MHTACPALEKLVHQNFDEFRHLLSQAPEDPEEGEESKELVLAAAAGLVWAQWAARHLVSRRQPKQQTVLAGPLWLLQLLHRG